LQPAASTGLDDRAVYHRILVMLMLTGGSVAALDIIAGEKETRQRSKRC